MHIRAFIGNWFGSLQPACTTEGNSLQQGRSGGSPDPRIRSRVQTLKRIGQTRIQERGEKKLLAYFVVKAATSRHRQRRQATASFVSATKLALSSLQSATSRNAGTGSSRSLVPTGPVGQSGPYQGTRTQSLSLSLSLSSSRGLLSSLILVRLPLADIFVRMYDPPRGRGEGERIGISTGWDRRGPRRRDRPYTSAVAIGGPPSNV
jgi:hypothetical protein